MKQLTNYQRVSNYLVKVFKAVNEEYFDNELEIMCPISAADTFG